MEMDAFCITAALCLYGLRRFEHNKKLALVEEMQELTLALWAAGHLCEMT